MGGEEKMSEQKNRNRGSALMRLRQQPLAHESSCRVGT